MVLCSLGSSALRIWNNTGSDDLDRLLSSTMSSSHLHVHLRDSSTKCRVSVFLVHVDNDGTGQVSEVDAVVSHNTRLLFKDLASLNDLSLDLSDFMLSLHVIPELGPGKDLITGEQAHSVNLWVWLSLAWKTSSDNIELSNLQRAIVSLFDPNATETGGLHHHLPSSN